jgi:hypothetical protein
VKALPEYVQESLFEHGKNSLYKRCNGIYLLNKINGVKELYIISLTSGSYSSSIRHDNKYQVDILNEDTIFDKEYIMTHYMSGERIIKKLKNPDYFWTKDQLKMLVLFS